MRKHLTLATLIGFCALSLTACQRGENKPENPTGTATAEQSIPANPGSEPMTTASNGTQTEQGANNGASELAASSSNSPAPNSQDLMQNQSADNSQNNQNTQQQTDNNTLNQNAPSATPDNGSNMPMNPAPSDQSGSVTQDQTGTTPESTTPPADQNQNSGSSDNTPSTNPPTGTEAAPPTGGSNTDTNSSTMPNTQ